MRRPPRSTRTHPLFPYTTPSRSRGARAGELVSHASRIGQALGAEAAEGVGAAACVDAVAVAASGDVVVAEAAGQHVLAAGGDDDVVAVAALDRSEEHTSELQ